MAWRLLRSAVATGRAVRHGVSSSGAAPAQPSRCYFHGDRAVDDSHPSSSRHYLYGCNCQVYVLLDKIHDTKMNMAKGDLLLESLERLIEDRQKKTAIWNSADLWVVVASCFAAYWGGSFGNSKARSERSLQRENGAQSSQVA